MKKLDIINRLSLAKSVTTAPAKLNIIKELMDIKESYYLGILENYKNVELPEIYQSDVNLIKPFVGFIQVAIDDDETHETTELRERGFLISIKVIKGEIYVGFVGRTDIPRFTIDMVSKWDFTNKKLIRLSGFYPHEPAHDETLEQVVEMLTPAVRTLIKEMIYFKLEVFEYEPTSFSFTKKIPPKDRHFFREYRLIKKVSVDEAKDEVAEKQLSKGFVRDTVLKNLFPQQDRYGHLLVQLKDSIWFSGLKDIIEYGETPSKPDLSNLPFDNFTVLAHHRSRSGNIAAVMVNVVRNNNGVDVYTYLESNGGKVPKFDLVYQYKISLNWVIQTVTIYPLPKYSHDVSDKDYRLTLKSVSGYFQDIVMFLLSRFLDVVFNYETTKVKGSFRKNKEKILIDKEPDYIAKNVHLVLDMFKRRQTPIAKGSRLAGYHMPEHDRIGHWRRKPHSNERIYIEGVRVNEGKGDLYGRVSKEYKL